MTAAPPVPPADTDQRSIVRRAVERLAEFVPMERPRPPVTCADCSSSFDVQNNFGRVQCPACRALFGPYSALLSEHGPEIEQASMLDEIQESTDAGEP